MTTVKELIEFLQRQPQDAIVIYRAYSDFNDLDLDDINLKMGKWTEKRGVREVEVWLTRRERDGHLMEVNDDWISYTRGINPGCFPAYFAKQIAGEKLEPLTAVCFPGN